MSTETFAYRDTTIWLVVSVLITAVVLGVVLFHPYTIARRRVSVRIGEVPCVARVSDGVLVVICKNNPRKQS